MRTVVLGGAASARLVDVDEPVPAADEVVVRTAVSALCGSELHTYRGGGAAAGNPGHEAAGTVVAVGANVAEPSIGQRVGVCAVAGCGTCPYCEQGQYTWCADRKVYTSMHAELFVAAGRACHPLPDDVSWDAAVLLSGDGLGVPFHSSLKIDAPSVRTLAVFGVGPIGLGHVLVQADCGREVIAIDLSERRLELARSLGAAEAVNAGDVDAVARVRALTEGRGADVCVEAAGNETTLRQCFAAVRAGGTVLINGEQGGVELSPSSDFIRRDITAVGSWFYHFSEFGRMLARYRGGLRVADLITHSFPAEEAGAAYQAFAAGDTGKVILAWSQ